mmetsp:Transcript_6168/g.24984  ORF Transcript_6168/g.24984 Transcript_6168/m.24984 type:complete len:245 (-) Transcript_6168:885-1619(-)
MRGHQGRGCGVPAGAARAGAAAARLLRRVAGGGRVLRRRERPPAPDRGRVHHDVHVRVARRRERHERRRPGLQRARHAASRLRRGRHQALAHPRHASRIRIRSVDRVPAFVLGVRHRRRGLVAVQRSVRAHARDGQRARAPGGAHAVRRRGGDGLLGSEPRVGGFVHGLGRPRRVRAAGRGRVHGRRDASHRVARRDRHGDVRRDPLPAAHPAGHHRREVDRGRAGAAALPRAAARQARSVPAR